MAMPSAAPTMRLWNWLPSIDKRLIYPRQKTLPGVFAIYCGGFYIFYKILGLKRKKPLDILSRMIYNGHCYMMSATMRTKGVFPMKKEYSAPLVKYLAFSVEETIASDGQWSDGTTLEEESINSMPWNDGELGWT